VNIIQYHYPKEAADVGVTAEGKNTNREVVKLGIETWNWSLY
jgi:hypothetical protein